MLRYSNDADSVIWMKNTGKSFDDLTNHLISSGYRAQSRPGDIGDPISQSILVEDQYQKAEAYGWRSPNRKHFIRAPSCARRASAAMRAFQVVLLIAALVPVAVSTQRSTLDEQQLKEVRARVNKLSEGLRTTEAITTDLDPIHLRIRAEIDGYIRTAFNPSQTTSNEVEERLRSVLADHIPNPGYGDQALARVEDLRRGRSLIVAYTIVRPPHHNLATIRGYREVQGRFELVAVTGGDFGDYNMFKAEIPSPIAGELWMLAWGQNHTSNGPVIRFRAYSFDGGTFKTVWSPEDFWGAKVTVTDRGFLIEHRSPARAPYTTRDEYVVTPEGPIKAHN